MALAIEVTNLKKGSGKRICHGDLTIREVSVRGVTPIVTLKECSVVLGQEGPFLGLPQRNYTDKTTGEVRYFNVVGLPEHTNRACLMALQDAWQAQQEAQQGAPQTQPDPDPNDPFA